MGHYRISTGSQEEQRTYSVFKGSILTLQRYLAVYHTDTNRELCGLYYSHYLVRRDGKKNWFLDASWLCLATKVIWPLHRLMHHLFPFCISNTTWQRIFYATRKALFDYNRLPIYYFFYDSLFIRNYWWWIHSLAFSNYFILIRVAVVIHSQRQSIEGHHPTHRDSKRTRDKFILSNPPSGMFLGGVRKPVQTLGDHEQKLNTEVRIKPRICKGGDATCCAICDVFKFY